MYRTIPISMLSTLKNNLKELPQADVIPPSLELDSATFVRGDNFIMGQEIWKDIVGLEGWYQISTFGRLRSIDRVMVDKDGFSVKYKGKLRANCVNKNRYIVNSIKGKTYFIHVQVAIAFIPNPENKPEVNHLDGDKSNCHVSNLAWSTRLENIAHAFSTGLIVPAVGINQSNTKFTEDQVIDIFNSKIGTRELGRMFGVCHTSISAIRNGKSWNHITGLPSKLKRKHTRKNESHN